MLNRRTSNSTENADKKAPPPPQSEDRSGDRQWLNKKESDSFFDDAVKAGRKIYTIRQGDFSNYIANSEL